MLDFLLIVVFCGTWRAPWHHHWFVTRLACEQCRIDHAVNLQHHCCFLQSIVRLWHLRAIYPDFNSGIHDFCFYFTFVP